MSDMFLTKDEVAELTGRKVKSKQVEQLRKMGLPFWVNALNAPVVPRSAVDGRKESAKPRERKLCHWHFEINDNLPVESDRPTRCEWKANNQAG